MIKLFRLLALGLAFFVWKGVLVALLVRVSLFTIEIQVRYNVCFLLTKRYCATMFIQLKQ